MTSGASRIAARSARKRACVVGNFALADQRALVRVQILDRVFDGDDVHVLIGVDSVHHAGEGRALAAARRAGDEHHAVSAGGREVDHHRRNMQRVRVRQAEGHDAAGRRQRAALLVGVAAEARLPVEGEGKIVVAVAAEHLVAVPARHAVGLLNHAGRVLGQELAFGQRHQMPLDLSRRGRTGNQKQIRSADFQHFLQDFRQFHGHSSPAASNSRSSPSGSPSSVTRRYTALT